MPGEQLLVLVCKFGLKSQVLAFRAVLFILRWCNSVENKLPRTIFRVLFVLFKSDGVFIDTQLMICQFYQSCSASSQSPATFLEPSVLVLAQEWLVFSFFFLTVISWWHFWRSPSLVVCSIFVCTLWNSVASNMSFSVLYASENLLKCVTIMQLSVCVASQSNFSTQKRWGATFHPALTWHNWIIISWHGSSMYLL